MATTTKKNCPVNWLPNCTAWLPKRQIFRAFHAQFTDETAKASGSLQLCKAPVRQIPVTTLNERLAAPSRVDISSQFNPPNPASPDPHEKVFPSILTPRREPAKILISQKVQRPVVRPAPTRIGLNPNGNPLKSVVPGTCNLPKTRKSASSCTSH